MLDAYRDLIDDLLGTPSQIRSWCDSGNSASPEITQRIAQIRDRDRFLLERVQAIIRQETPYLRPFSQPSSPADASFADALGEMEAARGDLVSILINLSLRDWERTAIDDSGSETTLAELVEKHVEFDEAQRDRLRELFAASR